MITNSEIRNFNKFHDKEFIMSCAPDLADLDIQIKILNTLEKGTKEYEALEYFIYINKELFFNGNYKAENINSEQSEILEKLRKKENLKASDELVEEYKKRIDELL